MGGSNRYSDKASIFQDQEHSDAKYINIFDVNFLSKCFGEEIALNPSLLNLILSIAIKEKIDRRGFFLLVGETQSKIGLLTAGLMKYYYCDDFGREYITRFVREGDFIFDPNSIQTSSASRYYIQAIESCALLTFEIKSLRRLISKHDELKHLFIRLLRESYLSKESHEADLLFLSASQRYEQFINNNKDLEKRLKSYQIASYLGITPECLSRVKKKLT